MFEYCFAKLKQFRRVATRYEKTVRNYAAVITIAVIVLWIRQLSTPPEAPCVDSAAEQAPLALMDVDLCEIENVRGSPQHCAAPGRQLRRYGQCRAESFGELLPVLLGHAPRALPKLDQHDGTECNPLGWHQDDDLEPDHCGTQAAVPTCAALGGEVAFDLADVGITGSLAQGSRPNILLAVSLARVSIVPEAAKTILIASSSLPKQ